MLLPYKAAVAGVTQGVNFMRNLDVSSFVYGTSRLRKTDGGELQHSEWEPEHCLRTEHWPSHPGPQRDQHFLLHDLWWCWPHRGGTEGLAQTVHQAGRYLNSSNVFDGNKHWDLCIALLSWVASVKYKGINCCVTPRLLFLFGFYRSRQRSLRRLKILFHHTKSRLYMWVCLYV